MLSRRLIRIKIIQSLYSHFLNEDNTVKVSHNNLLHSLEKSYELYYLMLMLPCDIAAYGRAVIETAKEKFLPNEEDSNPNMRFVDNPIIAYIENSNGINEFMNKKSISWRNNNELLKSFYNNMISKDYYKQYMSKSVCNFNDHKKFIVDFYKNEIEDFDFLYEEIEDMSIFWANDIEYAASHAMNTISQFTEKQIVNNEDISLPPIYKDLDDEKYVETLFIKSTNDKEENLNYIESFIRNWDLDRIAFMDKVILIVALTEIKNFDTIPLNVTMNEYIEISKYYSTLKSKNFINGILDKIVADLKEKEMLSPLKILK